MRVSGTARNPRLKVCCCLARVRRYERHQCPSGCSRVENTGFIRVQAYERSEPEQGAPADENRLQSWTEDFKKYSRRAVKVSAARGSFTALRY